MKPHPYLPLLALGWRLVAALLLGTVLIASASCSGPGLRDRKPDYAASIQKLESRFDQLESGRDSDAFWQALSAVFFVLAAFALIGGAALGSRARRDREQFLKRTGDQPEADPLDNPTP